MLLALDTATPFMSVALHAEHTLIAEQMLRTGNQHNTLLAASIQHLLATCNVPIDALTAVAACTGPGSYTGLRIGVALAKGIAAGRGLPLIGVSALDALAAGQPYQNTRHNLLAVVQAGRGRIIVGSYRARKGRWLAENAPYITTWPALIAGLEGSFYLTGEVDEAGHEALAAASARGQSLTLVSAAYRARRAGFLAQEAWRRLREGTAADFPPARVVPVYLKTESSAEG
ncbi:MAG: tRNA (adenosine(37)-N6)-threonylcarbamoyltransferase complex dimerization subunit type 1 TsaB [Anaerolineae bacterium]|jgi:tRNA threonylcarbamoyladenosine biosynthesis protein TsaB|nr:tRNA (adenosine(37)-N6)-threonylcarbamoyltransferase complex dimerization subunit type 1 TsaB [Anaerolineae bacterium]